MWPYRWLFYQLHLLWIFNLPFSKWSCNLSDVPESAADSNFVFKLTVTDDKDDSGTDDVTVQAEQIPQDESNSEGEFN